MGNSLSREREELARWLAADEASGLAGGEVRVRNRTRSESCSGGPGYFFIADRGRGRRYGAGSC